MADKDTKKNEEEEVLEEETELTEHERLEEANNTVRRHMYLAGGLGIIPIPLVDLAAVFAVQLKMLSKLCKLYGVRFRENAGKSLIASLIGGLAPSTFSLPVAFSLKAIPLVGPVLGAVTMPAFSGASTYAVGKVFVQHFESGGTMLTLDPELMKEYFAQQYSEGEAIAAAAKKR